MHPAAVDQRRVIPVAVKELPDVLAVHVEAVGRLVDAACRYERFRPAHAVMAVGQQHFVAGQRILKAAVEAAPLLCVVQGEIGHAHADGGIGAHVVHFRARCNGDILPGAEGEEYAGVVAGVHSGGGRIKAHDAQALIAQPHVDFPGDAALLGRGDGRKLHLDAAFFKAERPAGERALLENAVPAAF